MRDSDDRGYRREISTPPYAGVRVQITQEDSCQIQGDLMTHSSAMFEAALHFSELLHHGVGKFICILMDPPWDNTGLKLDYPTLPNEDWMP